MRILIVHNHVFLRKGGPEIYIEKFVRELSDRDIDYLIFGPIDSGSRYFQTGTVDDIGKFANENRKSLSKSMTENGPIYYSRIISNAFYNRNAAEAISLVLDEFEPEVLYLLQWNMRLSGSVINEASRKGVKIVSRLSDFNLVCGVSTLYHNSDVCTRCLGGKYAWQILLNCQHNWAYSFLDATVRYYNSVVNLSRKIDHFIIPSRHNSKFLIEHGIPKEKVTIVPTLSGRQFTKVPSQAQKRAIDFINLGRISEDKGLVEIINTFNTEEFLSSRKLLLVGEEDSIIEGMEKASHILSLGRVEKGEISEHLLSCKFSIYASRWFDNLPNSLIESALMGCVSIIPNFGSFSDLIKNGYPCISYERGCLSEGLKAAVEMDEETRLSLSRGGRSWMLDYTNNNKHMDDVLTLFANLIE